MRKFIKHKLNYFFWLVVGLFFFTACEDSSSELKENNHGAGTLKVYSDDTYEPLLTTSVFTFESIYPKAAIQLKYFPEEIAFKKLLEGETDVLIAGRELSEVEIEKIKQTGLKPKVNQIARDAIVLLKSKNTESNVITMDKIKSILSGDVKQLIVCDKSNSGNIAYLQRVFQLGKNIKNIHAVGSDRKVVEYLETHKEAIGIVGLSIISDADDPNVKEILTKVSPMIIQYKDKENQRVEVYPSQDAIATGKYPFIRSIFVINLDGNMNLGTGFANYLVSERVQRIVLKAGLMPYTLPSRELLIK